MRIGNLDQLRGKEVHGRVSAAEARVKQILQSKKASLRCRRPSGAPIPAMQHSNGRSARLVQDKNQQSGEQMKGSRWALQTMPWAMFATSTKYRAKLQKSALAAGSKKLD